jgi:hypothetical protein
MACTLHHLPRMLAHLEFRFVAIHVTSILVESFYQYAPRRVYPRF